MIYPFLTLNDDTEIVHSEILKDGSVKVHVETPVFEGFHSMIIYLPSYKIEKVNGYSQEEIDNYMDIIRSTAHLIIQFARQGGFDSAESF